MPAPPAAADPGYEGDRAGASEDGRGRSPLSATRRETAKKRNMVQVEKVGVLTRQTTDCLAVLTRAGFLHLFRSTEDVEPQDSIALGAHPRLGLAPVVARLRTSGAFELARTAESEGFFFSSPTVFKWELKAEDQKSAEKWVSAITAHCQKIDPIPAVQGPALPPPGTDGIPASACDGVPGSSGAQRTQRPPAPTVATEQIAGRAHTATPDSARPREPEATAPPPRAQAPSTTATNGSGSAGKPLVDVSGFGPASSSPAHRLLAQQRTTPAATVPPPKAQGQTTPSPSSQVPQERPDPPRRTPSSGQYKMAVIEVDDEDSDDDF